MFGKSVTATSVSFTISRFLLFLSGTIKPNCASRKMKHHHVALSLRAWLDNDFAAGCTGRPGATE